MKVDRRRGSTMVLAIVAMTFVALLGLAVVALTVSNIQMKQSEKESQTNFYDVDSVMDEIKAGIQDMSALSSTSAYSATLGGYSSVLSGVSTSLQKKYADEYMKEMVSRLSAGHETLNSSVTTYHYYDSIIEGYLSAANKDRYLSHTDGKGTMKYENGVLTLEDFEVESTVRSYKTHLKTDIRVTVPPLTSELHSEYLDYALIADNQILAELGSASVDIVGSAYAGTVERDSTHDESGIIVGTGTTLNIQAKNLISRGDILVRGGSSLDVKGNSEGLDLWVENILTAAGGATSGNNITIAGNINVADDLELNTESDNVTLTGNYYGYNYNSSYDTAHIASVSGDSKMSSAILINGRKCTLNMQGLKSLVLAGRTFISKGADGETYAGTSNAVQNDDIMMGESLTVKGTQLAYYVPSDFVTEVAASGAYPSYTGGKVTFQYGDDLTKAYVFDYTGYNDYVNAPGFNVLDYVDTNTPLVDYYRNDLDIKPVTYFYLNFKDKEQASAFYAKFKMASPKQSELDDINKEYISNAGITLAGGNAVLIRSGNILYKNPSSGQTELRLTNEALDVDIQLQKYSPGKAHIYMSKQMALIDDYNPVTKSRAYRLMNDTSDLISGTDTSGLTTDEVEALKDFSKSGYVNGTKKTNLFDVLVDRSKIAPVQQLVDNKVVVIVDGNFTWNSAAKGLLSNKDTGIIVATGNVELEENFNGMILAGGDISFKSAGVTASSASEDVAELFAKDKASATPLFFNMFSSYFRTAVDASLGTVVDKKDHITYENWDKQ